jgi:hypothetical protein
MRRRLVSMWLAPGLLALSLAACGGGATPAPSATPAAAATPTPTPLPTPTATPTDAPQPSASAPSGIAGETGTVSVPEIGFTITLADGWRAIPLTEEGLAAIRAALPEGSDTAALLESQADDLAASGLKLWAFDAAAVSVTDGFTSNMNVIAQPAVPGLTVSLLGTLAQAQLEALEGLSDFSVENVTLPAGDAVVATYRLDQPLASGETVSALGTQYYLASDAYIYIVTFTTTDADAAAQTAVFEAMARSISID